MVTSLAKSYYFLLLTGTLLISPSTLALAQSTPSVLSELPPPPPVPSDGNLPPMIDYDSPLPALPDNFNPQSPKPAPTSVNSEPINIPVTPSRVNNNSAPKKNRLYRVEIIGDSPTLLAQVQRLEPQAFIRSGEGVIQAGLFSQKENARNLLDKFKEQGLRGKVIAFNPSKKVAVSTGNRPSRLLGYFVVIPARKKNLSRVAHQIIRSGIESNLVTQQTYPRGSHVGVGPFASRRDAERWHGYFRSLGMNARIYFGR